MNPGLMLLALLSLGTGALAADLDFVRVPAGEFTQGNSHFDETVFELPDGDARLIEDELPPHRVRITRPFELSKTEVTQGQWFDRMGTRPGPAENWQRHHWRQLPVVSVTWHDAQRFIAVLNARARTARYRLPTEAEWEYAARAGSSGSRPFAAAELTRQAWYLGNSGDQPHPVAQFPANAWGLYDMLGNAWEWVADHYQPDYYAHSPRDDPPGPGTGNKRVRRGGSYHCQAHLVRVEYRAADPPATRYSVIGFRVVREPADFSRGDGSSRLPGHPSSQESVR